MTIARLVALAFALLVASPVQAAAPLTVATHEAPPFAMRGADGGWHGLAIDLWKRVARDEKLDYRFVPASLDDMVEGVRDGRFDASVGALTVTPEREARIDFTHPYFTTGFGIVARKAPPMWLSLLTNFFSWGFLQAVLALAALLGVVGLVFWLVERRANADQFGGGPLRGLGSGLWFSAVTMTTVGYGDKAPATAAGKAIALVWMFAAILIISTFTGTIASSLTAGRLAGAIEGPDDLAHVAVGSIRGSASDAWLARDGIAFRGFDDVAAGLDAVDAGAIDAFVYDKPILQYRVRERVGDDLRLLPGSFGRQDYGFALPLASPLREHLNVTLLRAIDGDEWRRELQATLGSDD